MAKRKSNGQPLKVVFKNLLKIYGMEDQYLGAEIISHYKELMGPAVVRQTSSIRYFNGVLSITLSSAVLKNEFSYASNRIKKLINEKLGSEAIKEVKIF